MENEHSILYPFPTIYAFTGKYSKEELESLLKKDEKGKRTRILYLDDQHPTLQIEKIKEIAQTLNEDLCIVSFSLYIFKALKKFVPKNQVRYFMYENENKKEFTQDIHMIFKTFADPLAAMVFANVESDL